MTPSLLRSTVILGPLAALAGDRRGSRLAGGHRAEERAAYFLGFVLLMATLLSLITAGYGTLPVMIGFLCLGKACLRLVIPTTMVLALERHGEIAGLASSLGDTLQMMVVGGMIALANAFFDGTATPMIAAILACGHFALVLTRLNATQDPDHQPG